MSRFMSYVVMLYEDIGVVLLQLSRLSKSTIARTITESWATVSTTIATASWGKSVVFARIHGGTMRINAYPPKRDVCALTTVRCFSYAGSSSLGGRLQ